MKPEHILMKISPKDGARSFIDAASQRKEMLNRARTSNIVFGDDVVTPRNKSTLPLRKASPDPRIDRSPERLNDNFQEAKLRRQLISQRARTGNDIFAMS